MIEEDYEDEPTQEDDAPHEFIEDLIVKAIASQERVQGAGWYPIVVYLGQLEWDNFVIETALARYRRVPLGDGTDKLVFEYKPDFFVDLRHVAQRRFLKALGDKRG